MNQTPKLICKNVWKLYGDNPKEFLQSHNNNPDKEIILQKKLIDLNDLVIDHKKSSYRLKEIFKICDTDAFLVMHKGKIKFEFYDKFTNFNTPHIVFSVSKSLTSLLTGILVEKKVINIIFLELFIPSFFTNLVKIFICYIKP